MHVRLGLVLIALVAAGPAHAQAPKGVAKLPITEDQRGELQGRLDVLGRAIEPLKGKLGAPGLRADDALADVAVYHKAADWALRLGEFYDKDAVAKTLRVLDRGRERAARRAAGEQPWTAARGGAVRGFVSKVDGSIQPYAVYVPEGYDPATPGRLDVVLHGRGATLNEVNFLLAHDGKPMPEGESGLLLHVFGRGNNAYRWAGEADVFEAIAAARRNYRVDERRIVLRGFSMGGAGAWHLGLHFPAEWAAVEAGAGFTESKQYARLRALPDYQAKPLHVYDAVDYALNATGVPIVGYGGEQDPQLQASENVVTALEALGFRLPTEGLLTRGDGIDFLRVVGAGVGHKVDPASAPILKTFRDEHAERGIDLRPGRIRFATYTLKYNRAAWLSVEGLREHYRRCVVEARIEGDAVIVDRADNAAVLAIDRSAGETVRLDGRDLPLRDAAGGLLPQVLFRRTEAGWETLDYERSRHWQVNAARGKRHDLQGPIDDAFAGPFLCVRGTGRPWSAEVQAWADARLERFRADWQEWMRGELPVKDDRDVSPEDLEGRHLILFGDPGSNHLLAELVPRLPLTWTKTELTLGPGRPVAAAEHAPILIAPHPGNPLRYVVLNSGHTFGAADFAGTNALLYPRLGDWAVLRVGRPDGRVEAAGLCDEEWRPR